MHHHHHSQGGVRHLVEDDVADPFLGKQLPVLDPLGETDAQPLVMHVQHFDVWGSCECAHACQTDEWTAPEKMALLCLGSIRPLWPERGFKNICTKGTFTSVEA